MLVVVSFSLAYANECAAKCQTEYYDYIETQKANYGHWGVADTSPMRCPDSVVSPKEKCPSDFYACREMCNSSNWDTCITVCWDSLQKCCLDNVMSNANIQRQKCIADCEAQLNDVLPAAAFKSESPFNEGVCTGLALFLMFIGVGSMLVGFK
ncbi:MAG: hypothetical protein QXS93_00945 [Candidatus Micrarchaeia archaeon]